MDKPCYQQFSDGTYNPRVLPCLQAMEDHVGECEHMEQGGGWFNCEYRKLWEEKRKNNAKSI